MKKINYIKLLTLLAVALISSSCNDFLDVNDDPNRVSSDNITPDLIFTNAQNTVGARQATRFVALNNWMGYWSRSGTFIVEQEETTYKIQNTFSDNNWAQAYNILFDLYQVKTRALSAKDSVLAGASMVLSVKLWQETVDQFGDIPYTQAFQSVKYPRPAYDKATDIYKDLLVQLDLAIKCLNATPLSSFAKADLIFTRGVEKNIPSSVVLWKKFANTIKLRMFLRQSQISGFAPTVEQKLKIQADGGFLGADENVAVNPGYSNAIDKQNPFYASFGLTPAGDKATTNNKPNSYFLNVILKSNDPRALRFYAGDVLSDIKATDYGALGGNQKDHNAVIVGTEIGPGLARSASQDQWILPAFESLFFQAEASQRGWFSFLSSADVLYEQAVRQSFKWLGTGDNIVKTKLSKVEVADSLATVFLQNNSSAIWNDATDKIKLIAFQKYVALCGIDAVEAWSDLRRGVLVLPAGYLSNNVDRAASLPNVMTYPQIEFTTNSTSLPTPLRSTTTIFTEKIFWQP